MEGQVRFAHLRMCLNYLRALERIIKLLFVVFGIKTASVFAARDVGACIVAVHAFLTSSHHQYADAYFSSDVNVHFQFTN